jgi:hypothetical protein
MQLVIAFVMMDTLMRTVLPFYVLVTAWDTELAIIRVEFVIVITIMKERIAQYNFMIVPIIVLPTESVINTLEHAHAITHISYLTAYQNLVLTIALDMEYVIP